MSTFGPRIEHDPYFTSSPFEPVLPPVTVLADIDLTDKALVHSGDLHAAFRLLRERAPVFRHDRAGASGYGGVPFWAVTTYEGTNQVLRNADVFSNQIPSLDLSAEEAGMSEFLNTQVGDYHRHYRGAVQGYTGPRAVAAAEEAIDRTVRDGVASFAFDGAVDIGPLANALPREIAIAFLGLRGEEADRLRHAYDLITDFLLHSRYGGEANGFAVLNDALANILESRRRARRDDVFSALLADEEAGRLTHHQVVNWCSFMVSNFFVATPAALYNPIVTLLHHPDQFAVLRSRPELIEERPAVEEILRWAGNAMHAARQAVVDTEILGQPIKAGEVVVAFQASANRDAAVFEDPYRLDLTKQRRRIATFGAGIHQCLGQIFIRAVVRSLLRALVENYATMEQTGPLVRVPPVAVIQSTVASIPMRGTRPDSRAQLRSVA